jgi:hypothetical protein
VDDKAKRHEYKKRIFRLAVQKARDNGFTHFVDESEEDTAKALAFLEDERINLFFDKRSCWVLILYDNSFCRAFWGTTYVTPIGKLWQYHRLTMIQSKDPFAYIARYL